MPRKSSSRSGPVLKIRPGKGGSLRYPHITKETRPTSSSPQESAGPLSITALLAEEGVCVLLLGPEQTLTFTGKCTLICLYGKVQVLGHTLNENEEYDLFSANTHGPMTVEALKRKKATKKRKEIRLETIEILRGYLPLDCRKKVMKIFKPSCSILLVKHLEEATTNYIMSHPEFASIFSTKPSEKYSSVLDEVLNSVGIENRDPDSRIVMPEKAILAAQELVDACLEERYGCPVIFVCGPQNVGKSTFNRYLLNRLLNDIPCVSYLECDIGQSEFTPPGSISLLNITNPVLGPPFTNQRDVQKMVFFGDASCEEEIERYFECVEYVIADYRREQPLIVNTMGWVKGFGLQLIVDLIRLLCPSHVVQMVAEGGSHMERLTPEYIRNSPGFVTKAKFGSRSKWLDYSEEDTRAESEHELHEVEHSFSGAGGTETVRCHGWILRDLAILGYMSKLQQDEQTIPLISMVPYQVPLNAVAVRIIHAEVAPTHVLYAANVSWVGLCRIPDDVRSQGRGPVILEQTPICNCLGFGIVRGIDMKKMLYYILTPVPPQALRTVNCLLIGSVSVPQAIFKNQPGIKGEIPYVTTEYDFSIYGSGKMKIKKNLKRPEHQ